MFSPNFNIYRRFHVCLFKWDGLKSIYFDLSKQFRTPKTQRLSTKYFFEICRKVASIIVTILQQIFGLSFYTLKKFRGGKSFEIISQYFCLALPGCAVFLARNFNKTTATKTYIVSFSRLSVKQYCVLTYLKEI